MKSGQNPAFWIGVNYSKHISKLSGRVPMACASSAVRGIALISNTFPQCFAFDALKNKIVKMGTFSPWATCAPGERMKAYQLSEQKKWSGGSYIKRFIMLFFYKKSFAITYFLKIYNKWFFSNNRTVQILGHRIQTLNVVRGAIGLFPKNTRPSVSVGICGPLKIKRAD